MLDQNLTSGRIWMNAENRFKWAGQTDALKLFNRNVELKKMTFPDSTFEIDKGGLEFGSIQHDFMPAIPAVNVDFIIDLGSAFSIPLPTTPTDHYQFDAHTFSEVNMVTVVSLG
jgi:hypothetical protein